jgi:dienelactone hydrolase
MIQGAGFRSGMLLIVLILIANLLAYIVSKRLYGPKPDPTGPYRVTHSQIQVAGPNGPIPVELWIPELPEIIPGPSERSYPLLLFASGWGGNALSHSLFLQDLSSQGYVIAGFNDIGQDAGDASHEVAQIANAAFDLASEEASRKSQTVGDERVKLNVAKSALVFNGVKNDIEVNRRLSGRTDFERVGFVGYSLGGAVAAEASLIDKRIRAVVNLDGWLFAQAAKAPPSAPYLLVHSADSVPQADDLRSATQELRNSAEWSIRDIAIHDQLLGRPGFHWFLLRGVRHEDMKDQMFSPSLRDALKEGWADRLQKHHGLVRLVSAFLQHYLDKEAPKIFRPPAEILPLMKVKPNIRGR